jgi:hypothetical protein
METGEMVLSAFLFAHEIVPATLKDATFEKIGQARHFLLLSQPMHSSAGCVS